MNIMNWLTKMKRIIKLLWWLRPWNKGKYLDRWAGLYGIEFPKGYSEHTKRQVLLKCMKPENISKHVPDHEKLLWKNPDALASVQKGLKQSDKLKETSKTQEPIKKG